MSLSERRACSIVGADRNMIRYRSSRPADAVLRGRLRDLANERRRFGYRSCSSCCAGGRAIEDQPELLALPRGSPHRPQAAGLAQSGGDPCPDPGRGRPNARWSLDFVHDQFANGRRFRILNIVDEVTKECLGAIPVTSISGRRVARELTAIVELCGKPE